MLRETDLLVNVVDILVTYEEMEDADFRNGISSEVFSNIERRNLKNTTDLHNCIGDIVDLAVRRGLVSKLTNAIQKRKFLSIEDEGYLREFEEHFKNKKNKHSSPEIDVVIVTALSKERDAILRHLDSPKEIKANSSTAHRASILAHESDNSYHVILLCLHGMGNSLSAAAAARVIAEWTPKHIILTGIAGGIKDSERHLGDVIIAEQIVHYELGKATVTGTKPRYEVFRPAYTLLESAKNLPQGNWTQVIFQPRPSGTKGREISIAHFGPVASGDKVVADSSFITNLLEAWPKLIGIEMEGGGTALAAYQSERPGVFLVKGICDWADSEKDDKWQEYAADAAASFITELLKTKPF